MDLLASSIPHRDSGFVTEMKLTLLSLEYLFQSLIGIQDKVTGKTPKLRLQLKQYHKKVCSLTLVILNGQII